MAPKHGGGLCQPLPFTEPAMSIGLPPSLFGKSPYHVFVKLHVIESHVGPHAGVRCSLRLWLCPCCDCALHASHLLSSLHGRTLCGAPIVGVPPCPASERCEG